MATGTKHPGTKINGKSVRGSLSDGTTTIIVDYKGETQVLLPLEEREFEDFRSQDIDEKSVVGNPSFGSITQTITFSEEVYKKLEEWYIKESLLTYTVSGLFTEDKVYEDIMVHIPDTPAIDPERKGYITNSIGLKSKKAPSIPNE